MTSYQTALLICSRRTAYDGLVAGGGRGSGGGRPRGLVDEALEADALADGLDELLGVVGWSQATRSSLSSSRCLTAREGEGIQLVGVAARRIHGSAHCCPGASEVRSWRRCFSALLAAITVSVVSPPPPLSRYKMTHKVLSS